MSEGQVILILDDEPVILMDLEWAAEDMGHRALCAVNCAEALQLIEAAEVDTAVLDVSLKGGETCERVARELGARGIPYVLHSGDLDRQGETVARLGAPLVPKPANSQRVIAAAVELAEQATANDWPMTQAIATG